jgi:hypothetical protein
MVTDSISSPILECLKSKFDEVRFLTLIDKFTVQQGTVWKTTQILKSEMIFPNSRLICIFVRACLDINCQNYLKCHILMTENHVRCTW